MWRRFSKAVTEIGAYSFCSSRAGGAFSMFECGRPLYMHTWLTT
jgi:hypothetical protein